ncbi:MAG: 2OG-Fe(II) oxygenase [Alphaproteobacteria bacterium]|nr:2OG-Fe(II) oxygenase [Alphaproteobacteria bacterium]
MGHPALIGTVFEKLTADVIRADPFPHAVIENALPPERYAALAAAKPEVKTAGPNRRSALPGWLLATMDFVDPIWADFARAHLTPRVVAGLADVFGPDWRPPLPDAPDLLGMKPGWVGGEVAPVKTGLPATQDEADLFLDCRLETIGASPNGPGSHRRQHLDLACRYFSALFYLRDPEDDTKGGGLTLFRWAGDAPAGAFEAFEVDADRVEPAVTVPYAANSLVVFPNGPTALHGAEERAATRFQRHYVFITAEGSADLW